MTTDDGHWHAMRSGSWLAPGGIERSASPTWTAVLAAEHGMTVLHSDSDFEIAAGVLDFEHRWVLP